MEYYQENLKIHSTYERQFNDVGWLWKVVLSISCLTCFYGYWLNNNYLLTTINFFLVFLVWIIKERRILYRKSDIIFGTLIIVFLLSSISSPNRTEAFKYVFSLSQLFLLAICLQSNKLWSKYFLKISYILSFGHVLATAAYYVIPEQIDRIRIVVLNPEALDITNKLLRSGLNSGIAPQTGNNAYYISVFVGISFSYILKFLEKKNNKLVFFHLLLMLIGLSMLIATGKRGPLLSVAISVILVTIIYILSSTASTKNFFIIGLIGLISLLVLINTSVFKNLIEMISLKQGDNFLSGRSLLWSDTLKTFEAYPFFGQGLLSMRLKLGLDSHNVYLQLLAETGLVGFLTFIWFTTSRLINSAVLMFNKVKSETSIFSLYFQIFFLCYCFTGNPIYNLNLFVFYIIFISIR
ncbi:O-antigen ligase family protein [Enterococcus xiangfangensis]|uniref:O-antigen ligase family protein n=1 Tax=Enterococcus xiangfangensis TaxID=1296537 RepID=UPI0010F5C578|nr:O-antigen ligase family protein [Enterococcus xiangfangensis]MBM7712764.1 hypothetical protein [Enterococcus xiangfangensis]